MSPKLVLGLALATLVSVVGAVIAVIAEPGTGNIEVSGEPAFPELRESPDAVHRVEVEAGGERTVLERQDDGSWSAISADGYRGWGQRVRDLVIQLADMQLIEAKTANPKLYPRLEVEDPETEGAASRLVRLIDADGEALVRVLIGKTRDRLTGMEAAGTYIRRLGDQRSWLASGRIELPQEPALWLERRIVDLPGDDVVRVEVQPPGSPSYALVREEETWALEGDAIPLSADSEPDAFAGALEALDLRGVRTVEQVEWPEEVWRFRFRTGDGLEVALRLAAIEDQPWAQIEAATAAEDAEQPVRERAEAIVERTEGWTYRLPDDVATSLRRPRTFWTGEETS